MAEEKKHSEGDELNDQRGNQAKASGVGDNTGVGPGTQRLANGEDGAGLGGRPNTGLTDSARNVQTEDDPARVNKAKNYLGDDHSAGSGQ